MYTSNEVFEVKGLLSNLKCIVTMLDKNKGCTIYTYFRLLFVFAYPKS